jgi:hypothetical protein
VPVAANVRATVLPAPVQVAGGGAVQVTPMHGSTQAPPSQMRSIVVQSVVIGG